MKSIIYNIKWKSNYEIYHWKGIASCLEDDKILEFAEESEDEERSSVEKQIAKANILDRMIWIYNC